MNEMGEIARAVIMDQIEKLSTVSSYLSDVTDNGVCTLFEEAIAELTQCAEHLRAFPDTVAWETHTVPVPAGERGMGALTSALTAARNRAEEYSERGDSHVADQFSYIRELLVDFAYVREPQILTEEERQACSDG